MTPPDSEPIQPRGPKPEARVSTIVKIGGSLARAVDLRMALTPLRHLARREELLIVPGGGPFANVVRAESRRHRLGDPAAHWMAILGMDQYAHLLADLLEGAELVRGPEEIAGVLAVGRLPVLAPYAWLRSADPLPHGWGVTADSIAAWVAGMLGARRLILVKSSPERAGVDPYLASALPDGIEMEIVVPEGVRWRRTR